MSAKGEKTVENSPNVADVTYTTPTDMALTALVVDPKVMEGVDEPVSTISKSFASLVTNEAVTSKSWGRMNHARALIDIRAHRELKEGMVIVSPNVENDEEVLHTVRVEYEWEPPRCGVCMVFGHDDMLCPKRNVKKPKKQHTNHDGFQHPSSSHGIFGGSKVHFKPIKPVWQVVSKKNSASSSGTKKNYEVSRKVKTYK
nr:hypothetical protein [Tanacetum cinerariifolium]